MSVTGDGFLFKQKTAYEMRISAGVQTGALPIYRSHRYGQHLSQTELNHRIRDVFLRLLTLTPNAKIGVLPVSPEGGRWFELWTHVLEEIGSASCRERVCQYV